jgi:myotubularin-related protein 6/7/8
LTDRHLIFIEPTGLKETWVLYHHIQSVDRQPLTTKGYPLIIDTKTFQQLCLIIPRETDCHDVIETINLFSKPDKYEDLYGFNYKPNTEGFPQTRGWNLYDPLIEYDRMEVPSDLWKHTNLNQSYEMCETYSSVLYVPAEADPSVILGSAKFRSKGRLPVLSYFCSNKKSALCRCSQPLSYITRRSPEDEAMIQCIIDANPNSSFLYLLDTRPKVLIAIFL